MNQSNVAAPSEAAPSPRMPRPAVIGAPTCWRSCPCGARALGRGLRPDAMVERSVLRRDRRRLDRDLRRRRAAGTGRTSARHLLVALDLWLWATVLRQLRHRACRGARPGQTSRFALRPTPVYRRRRRLGRAGDIDYVRSGHRVAEAGPGSRRRRVSSRDRRSTSGDAGVGASDPRGRRRPVGVTGGTIVRSDRIVVHIHAGGRVVPDRMIALVERRHPAADAGEVARRSCCRRYGIFLIVVVPLWAGLERRAA